MARSILSSTLAVLCSVAALTMPLPVEAGADDPGPAAEVNTFIGTKDDGNTFPGASAAFGLIQVSPIGEHYSGWRYDEPKIKGFGHSFISGAGCGSQGGHLSILPVTGTIGPGGQFDTSKTDSFDHHKYAAAFTHEGEVGQAGYYKVRLTDYGGIDVEATALTRAAAERYTFAPGAQAGHILVNTGQANKDHWVVGSSLQVVGDRVIEGRIVTNSFCGGQQYTTWFRTEFDRPFASFGVWNEHGGKAGSHQISMQGDGRQHGAWFTFDLEENRSITAVTSISHVDAEGAKHNLATDGRRNGRLIGFDAMRAEAQKRWDEELASVRIDGASADDRAVFYTALYHALLQPLTGSDADGRYRGYDGAIHRAEGWTYYEYWSLWDTYRTQNQLLAVLRPKRARDMARSLLAVHEQNGWLPRWGYANFDSNVMTGDPVTPFMADLWRFGALEGRERDAYGALRQNAFETPSFLVRSQGRAGNPHYLAQGYIAFDRAYPAKSMDVDQHHGGSATMEYALADCSLAEMAEALGEDADAAVLRRRGSNWRYVWDASVTDKEAGFTGFPRPRVAGGDRYTDLDGGYSPRSHFGFHEGTAWQYQWLVQQDAPGLAAAMGGQDRMVDRLDAFFAYDALVKAPLTAAREEWVVGPYDYYNQFRYNPNNEPDLHAPWMYTLIGQPWKTATAVRAQQALFTNAPDGVTGNDDLGTMSAWYLWSAIGLYPVMPGTGELVLHTPRFPRIEIDLGEGKELVITATGAKGDSVQAVQGATLNGRRHDRVWVEWDDLRDGARIDFALGSQPRKGGWGTKAAALPAPACPAN